MQGSSEEEVTMPGKTKRLIVVLCATLTADGKLDAESPTVPPVLYGGDADPARHPWGKLYDDAAGVLVDGAAGAELPMPPTAGRMVISVHSERAAGGESDVRGEVVETWTQLRREGVAGYLLCFGGAELFRVLLAAGWADELRLIVRPTIDGRRGSAALSGAGSEFFPASIACRLLRMEAFGDECLLHYRVRRRGRKKD